MTDKIWTVIELLAWGEVYLKKKGVLQARLNIEFLLSHVLNKNRLDLYLAFEDIVYEDTLKKFKGVITRRIEDEPLMYILGETNFFDAKIKVDPSVLIPRSETEWMVDEAVAVIKDKKPRLIYDFGTGSGCIAIALALQFQEIEIHAVDISKNALKTASINAERNKVSGRIKFFEQDMLSFMDSIEHEIEFIIANVPYVSMKDYQNLDRSVKQHEPKMALTDDKDGKYYIQGIIERLHDKLNGFAFLEIDCKMENWISELLLEHHLNGKIISDLHHLPRFVRIEKKQPESG